MMKSVRRSCFTLLELLLVLLLLGIGMSVTAIQIKKAYAEQQFLSEVEQVRSHLQMVQDLMLIADADADVKFGEVDKTLYYEVELLNKTFKSPIFENIVKSRHLLKSIRAIEFEGLAAKGNQEILLKFFSKGFAMSQGKLILSPSDTKSQESYQIVLAGRPQMLESQKYEDRDLAKKETFGPEIYPKELHETNN